MAFSCVPLTLHSRVTSRSNSASLSVHARDSDVVVVELFSLLPASQRPTCRFLFEVLSAPLGVALDVVFIFGYAQDFLCTGMEVKFFFFLKYPCTCGQGQDKN